VPVPIAVTVATLSVIETVATVLSNDMT